MFRPQFQMYRQPEPEVEMGKGDVFGGTVRGGMSPLAGGGMSKTPMERPMMMSYEKGTDRVPKTGKAVLHKDEAVLDKDTAEDYREGKPVMHPAYKGAEEGMSGKDKPKKEIKEIHHRKGHGGKGHIMTHKHTHPEHHPDEEHVMGSDKEMMQHMMDNASTGDGTMPEMPEAPETSGAPAGAAGGAGPVPGM